MRVQNFQEDHRRAARILLGNMSWKTIYIVGKTDFREEVSRKLQHSSQRYMPGFVDSSNGENTHDLYWLDGRTDLREFKEAIGGKLIWKHRLRFYPTLEEFLQSQQPKTELTPREKQMIAEMRHTH